MTILKIKDLEHFSYGVIRGMIPAYKTRENQPNSKGLGMEFENPEAQAFLYELYTMTEGDMDRQVSMYDIGDRLGLDKNQAGNLGETLYIQGYAALKTLSGGMGITREGIQALGKTATSNGNSIHVLGDHRVLTNEDREAVEALLDDIKTGVPDMKKGYEGLSELVIDIKTLEVQLLSEKPKTEIVRQVLHAMADVLAGGAADDILDKIRTMTGLGA